VTATTAASSGSGCFSGPAVKFTITFSQPVTPANVVTNVGFGSSQAPGCEPTDPVINGNAITYVFAYAPTTPADQRSTATISTQPSPTSPVGTFLPSAVS
jgi:hypothetical protein